MSTYTSLAGMFFLRDNGDTYLTGEIIAQVHQDAYLLKPDNMTNLPVDPPCELMSVGAMTAMNELGIPVVSLFQTRDELTAWIDWLEKPSEPRVINLVKK